MFVRKGFDGARIDEIAGLADVNKRMIYVYFNDKVGLWREVLEGCLARLVEDTRRDLSPDGDPRDQAASVIRRYVDFLDANPGVVRLLAWESLNDGRRAGPRIDEALAKGLEDLHGILKRGIAAGVFRKEMDPQLVVVSIAHLCGGWFRSRLGASLFGENPGRPGRTRQFREHAVRMVLDGIGA
jgi:TetR/AcrR family transcriptional regulator